MKKIKFKKPNLKEGFNKLKSLRWADIKAAPKRISAWHDRKLEKLQNSAFGQKMHTLGQFMNRYSLIFHGIWAIMINYIIEAMSRHSVMAAWEFSRISTKAFLYNAFMIFATFSIVYLFKRRALGRTILSILWRSL